MCADIDADIEMHAHAFAFAHDNQGRACHLHMQILLRDARAKGFAPVICVSRKGGRKEFAGNFAGLRQTSVLRATRAKEKEARAFAYSPDENKRAAMVDFVDSRLDEERKDCRLQLAESCQNFFRAVPAERGKSRRRVDKHQPAVNAERKF